MSRENPLWGASRIHGELLKLGIDIGETTVGKYMARGRKPPSQTWRNFLENHFKTMVSVDFFTVPTIRFQVLYVFLVLAHDRRRILYFAVTAHPTAEWTAQQLREAFPWDSAPRFLLHRIRIRFLSLIGDAELGVFDNNSRRVLWKRRHQPAKKDCSRGRARELGNDKSGCIGRPDAREGIGSGSGQRYRRISERCGSREPVGCCNIGPNCERHG
jgi:hypothetical protein